MAGSNQSKQVASQPIEQNQSNGVHLFEFHMPTAGVSIFGLLFVLGLLYCARLFCRSRYFPHVHQRPDRSILEAQPMHTFVPPYSPYYPHYPGYTHPQLLMLQNTPLPPLEGPRLMDVTETRTHRNSRMASDNSSDLPPPNRKPAKKTSGYFSGTEY